MQIVIMGAGKAGEHFINSIRKDGNHEVVAAVDNYRSGEIGGGENIHGR